MSRLGRNIVYNVMGQGLVLALGFIGVKFIFNRLGGDAFGIIYFNQVLTGVLTTALELGLLATMVREVSAHYASEPDYVERLIRTASVLYWGIGLLLFGAVFMAAPLLVERWVNLKTIDPGTAATMLRFLSVLPLIMLPRAMYSSLFQGRQRMELNNSIDVTSSAAQQIGIIVVLATGGNAFAAVQWIAFSAILSTLAYMAVTARLFGWRCLVPTYFQSVVRRNLRFTAHMGALSMLNMVLIQFDKIVVSKLLPIASVGYYSFASTVVIRMSFAVAAVGQAALPSYARLNKLADLNGLQAQYRRLQDLLSYGIVPVIAAATFAALPLFTFIFNREIASLLLLPTALLSVGFFAYATVNQPYTFAVALGKPDIASRSYVVALLVSAPVIVILIYFFGLIGAAAWWTIYHLVLYAHMIPKICRECLQIRPAAWYAQVVKVVALSGLTYGAAWFLIAAPYGYRTGALAAGYVVATLAFMAGSYLLMGQELRQSILRIPRRLMLGKAAGPS